MRSVSGKGSNARKILAYYSVNFDLSVPYRVLCDGPTVFQALKKDLYLKQSLPVLLGATAYPVVTNCIVTELRNLGEAYSNASLFAKRVTRVPCAHDGHFSANECVIARLKKPFENKLFLATSDLGLLAEVSKIPGVPIITIVNQTKLSLRSPSAATLAYVRRKESSKSINLSVEDKKLLEKLRLVAESNSSTRSFIGKRKRAKGPNPLSVKKSKQESTKGVDLGRNHTHVDEVAIQVPDGEDRVNPKPDVIQTASAPLSQNNCIDDELTAERVAVHVSGDEEVGGTTKQRRRKRKRKGKKGIEPDETNGERAVMDAAAERQVTQPNDNEAPAKGASIPNLHLAEGNHREVGNVDSKPSPTLCGSNIADSTGLSQRKQLFKGCRHSTPEEALSPQDEAATLVETKRSISSTLLDMEEIVDRANNEVEQNIHGLRGNASEKSAQLGSLKSRSKHAASSGIVRISERMGFKDTPKEASVHDSAVVDKDIEKSSPAGTLTASRPIPTATKSFMVLSENCDVAEFDETDAHVSHKKKHRKNRRRRSKKVDKLG